MESDEDEDVPFGISVDYIIDVGRRNDELSRKYLEDKEHGTNGIPRMFGMKVAVSATSSSLKARKDHQQLKPSKTLSLLSLGNDEYLKNRKELHFFTPRVLAQQRLMQRNQHTEQMLSALPHVPAHDFKQPSTQNASKNPEILEDGKGLIQSPFTKPITMQEKALNALFEEFDKDYNKKIDLDELEDMLVQLRKRSSFVRMDGTIKYIMAKFSRQDAQRILDALDTDRNGTIGQEEWTSWIVSGLADSDARKRLIKQASVAKNPLSKKLKQLLDATEIVSNKWIVKEGGKIKRRKSYYEKYDSQEGTEAVSDSELNNNPKPATDEDRLSDLSQKLHHFCCKEDLNLRVLNDFFATIMNSVNFDADLLVRASCQVDRDTNMTALHFLSWHEQLDSNILRAFLKHTGSKAIPIEDGEGGTALSHLILNYSLDYQKTLECFKVIKEYDPHHADQYLQAHGGTFQKLWENAQSEGGMLTDDSEASMSQKSSKESVEKTNRHLNDASSEQTYSDSKVGDPGDSGDIMSTEASMDDVALNADSEGTGTLDGRHTSENSDKLGSEDDSNKNDSPGEDSTKNAQGKSLVVRMTSTPPHVRCIHGHVLDCHIADYEWSCDRCDKAFDVGTSVHACHDDEYDICDTCCRRACIEQHEHDMKIPYVVSSQHIGLFTNEDILTLEANDLNLDANESKGFHAIEEIRM